MHSVGRKTLKKGDIFHDLGIDGRILLKYFLSRMGSWRNMETSDELLWAWLRTSVFHKMKGTLLTAAKLLNPQQELFHIELVV
jgi:hypothetical protein